jgi:hypothetical protein
MVGRQLVVLAAIAACIAASDVQAQSERWGARRPVPPEHIADERWRVSKMVRLPLYNEERERIGTIVELLIRPGGRVPTVIIDTSTLTRANERKVAIPFANLSFSELSPRSSEAVETARVEGKSPTRTEKRIVAIAANGDWKPNHAVLHGVSVEQLRALPAVELNDAP